MPMYEYRCDKCGEVFELIQKFSDAPLATHPGCGGTVERLLSAPALQFKGSGWYVTDYGRNGSAGKEKGAGSTDTKKGNKTESKPASNSGSETPSTSKPT